MATVLLYSYDKISKNEKFKEFMDLINNGTPIKLVDWSETLGFGSITSFRTFLKRYKIKYNLKKANFDLDETKIKQIKIDYNENKLTVKDVAKKYNIPYNAIYKIVEPNGKRRERGGTIRTNLKHNLGIENTIFGQMKLLLEKNNVKFEIIHKDSDSIFVVECCECGKSMQLKAERYKERLGEYAKIKCSSCWVNNHMAPNAPSRPLNPKNNTSGYIGVSIKNAKDYIYGYRFIIQYKNKILLAKNYKDKTLSNKTLIEAVVDREKYIIENNLPHTRNFSNDELISNMEMLGQYGDIDLIKTKLGI